MYFYFLLLMPVLSCLKRRARDHFCRQGLYNITICSKLLIKCSALNLQMKNCFDGRCQQWCAGALQFRVPRGGCSYQNIVTRLPKQPKWSPKRCPNEPRNLQRHPCGAGSNRYRKQYQTRVPNFITNL